MRLEVQCPAKVNLFLSVGPPDQRGYHPLRTVFQAISLCDTLIVKTGVDSTTVRASGAEIPQNNTVSKAIRLASEYVELPPMEVLIEKRIPSEAGLGGGSSDAAGMLRAIQRVAPVKLGLRELNEVALAIGADVPFFLLGGLAKGEGYGEVLTAMEDGPTQHFVVAKPNVGCPTADAYRSLDSVAREWRPFAEVDSLYNDFERVAPCESLDLIERLLALGARDAGLTGSGSAVFGRFEHATAASRCASQVAGKDVVAWPCQSLSRAQSLELNVL